MSRRQVPPGNDIADRFLHELMPRHGDADDYDVYQRGQLLRAAAPANII